MIKELLGKQNKLYASLSKGKLEELHYAGDIGSRLLLTLEGEEDYIRIFRSVANTDIESAKSVFQNMLNLRNR